MKIKAPLVIHSTHLHEQNKGIFKNGVTQPKFFLQIKPLYDQNAKKGIKVIKLGYVKNETRRRKYKYN